MKHFLYLGFALILLSGEIKAQSGDFFFNGKGQPFLKNTNADIDGSPYLTEKWLPGRVQTIKGKIYDNLKIKYDINTDDLLFAYDSADEPLKFSDEIRSFVIYMPEEMLFSNGFPAVDKQNHESYYRILSNGSTKFLKRYNKVIHETKVYNTINSTKAFQDFNLYYLFRNGKMEKVDNPKKTLYALAGDKKVQLDEFVKSNAVNFKKDEDLIKAFNFLNSLGI